MLCGAFAGWEIGSQIVAFIVSSTDQNTFVSSYKYVLTSNASFQFPTRVMFTLLGACIAFLISTAAFNQLVRIGDQIRGMQTSERLAVAFGFVFGLVVTFLVYPIVAMLKVQGVVITLMVLIAVMCVYLGIVLMMSSKDELPLLQASNAGKDAAGSPNDHCKILDTNVIIDGRVADICRTGFMEGPIYVPGFVLDELQHIADSSDGLKRARGRRGLDILNQMRTELKMMVRTYDKTDPNDRDEVDAKLVKLAKELNGMIVTNDFNLNKVAELQGVTVLNINELANALKPVVLPGEEMTVTIIKEGKEINQGVAYLDDGTMIVVEGGRRHIGETLDVVTSSVLQTVAGKMIFASIRNHAEDEDDGYDRHIRPYSSRGPRRKIQH
ncbi:MAG: PIN/TRAM domain-containing protein [Capsulimonadaceae bacterium]